MEVEKYIYPMNAFVVAPGWVDEAPSGDLDKIILTNMHVADEASHDSTSVWRFLEEYYASDDDNDCDSILPLPGVPRPMRIMPSITPHSPNTSNVSVDHPSSTASNDIPNFN
ncbi:UNVERIFIED_CONTAM: hypothetical protein Sradi_1877800 [Sesamum radiatum]|uniref:Uncharacterized protein n=1 Tax=Sesamum radiatum TaxID=300843 RepID=A0AAW2TXJ6_SESRA